MATAQPLDSSDNHRASSRRLAGATGIMMVTILASRLLGLVRDMVISGRLGQSMSSDVYYAAFMIPDLLFFLIAGGALSSAFIPVFTDKLANDKEDEAWHVFSTVACVMFVVISVFVVLGEVFTAQLMTVVNRGFSPAKIAATVPLTRIVLPAQLCFFLGGLLMGTQYARQRFFIPALGPIVYNVGIIAGGVFLYHTFGIRGFFVGALTGAFIGNFALQLWGNKREGMRFHVSFDWRHPDVMQVWKLMLPVVLGLALPQVSIYMNRYFAASLGDGPFSAISRANALMQVPLGIFAQAMAVAIFPALSAQAAQGKFDEMRSTASRGIRSLLFLTIPSSVLMIVLAVPIIQLLLQHGKFHYQDGTLPTALALNCYAIGIFAWSAQSILARGFYALKDSVSPVAIGTVVTLVFIPMNLLFRDTLHLGYAGLALATTVAACLHMFVMLFVLRKRLNGFELRRMFSSVSRVVVASLVAGAVCLLLRRFMDGIFDPALPATMGRTIKLHALITLAVCSFAGVVVYGGMAVILRVEETEFVTSLLRRRRAA